MRQSATNTIEIAKGEYVILPNSNKWAVCGPAKLKITRYSDGGVDGQIIEGKSSPARLAVFHKLTLVSWGI